MTFTTRILIAPLLLGALAFPAAAQEQPQQEAEIGNGVMCDTPQQVERFASLFHGDTNGALKMVNGEAARTPKVDAAQACGIVQAVYVRGNGVRTTRTHDGFAEIVEVNVIAVFDGGWKPIRPITQYTLVRPKETQI